MSKFDVLLPRIAFLKIMLSVLNMTQLCFCSNLNIDVLLERLTGYLLVKIH
jgi:hypothetical protein